MYLLVSISIKNLLKCCDADNLDGYKDIFFTYNYSFLGKDDLDLRVDVGHFFGNLGVFAICVLFSIWHKKWADIFNKIADFKRFGEPPKFKSVQKQYNRLSGICFIYSKIYTLSILYTLKKYFFRFNFIVFPRTTKPKKIQNKLLCPPVCVCYHSSNVWLYSWSKSLCFVFMTSI